MKFYKISNTFLSILFLVLVFGLTLKAGETGKLSGKIIDKTTGEALLGANITVIGKWVNGKETPIKDFFYGAATDMNGEYFIINLPAGRYSVKATFVGYKEEIKTQVLVKIDQTTRLNFDLLEEALVSGEVVVTAYRPDKVEVELTATKQSYDISQVQSMPGISDVGDIIGLQVDVSDGHFRGGRTGESLYLIAGANVVNPLNNSVAFEPMTMALEQVEVYTSGFSAEYGNVQSGIINMVTKEGASTWQTNVKFSSTNSYYKTWGGSVFDEDRLDFFSTLNELDEWVDGTDPKSGKVLWAHFGIGFPENYLPPAPITWPPTFISREDSMRTASLVRAMWLQGIRGVGREYDKPDYRVEFSTGGPIAEKLRLFFAGRLNTVQPLLPTTDPNSQKQIISNIVYHANNSNKLKINFNYNFNNTHVFGSNFFNWYEGVLNYNLEQEESMQIGLQWNHILNKKSYIDVKANYLTTSYKEKINLLGDDEFSNIYVDYSNWRFYTDPTGNSVGRMNTTTEDSDTKTFNFSTSYSIQLNKNNFVKAGFQFNYYDLKVDNRRSASNASNLRLENYSENPYEGAFYIQDKMEFEGLIANLGLRMDFYDFNTTYYTDKFSPFRNPDFDFSNPSGPLFDENLAGKKDTELVTVIQPRIGLSFPVNEQTVLHLNYGVFTQRPAFEYIFVDRVRLEGTPNYVRLGNPELEPERTVSYDFGIVRSLPLGFFLDISAYMKDVSNLLQFTKYQDRYGNQYQTFDNREYADVKGFHINLEKNMGMLRGYVRYNWQSSKGKSGSAVGPSERTIYIEDTPENNTLPDPEDIYLDYDRTHKVLVNVTLDVSDEGLLGIEGFKPFADVILSATYRYQSGRPFTWDDTGEGLRFNQRTPDEHDLKLRVQKLITINNTDFKFFLEAYNLLNHKTYNYSRTFNEDPENPYRQRWIENKDNIDTDVEFAPYTTNIAAYLVTNQPRHFRFGVEVNF